MVRAGAVTLYHRPHFAPDQEGSRQRTEAGSGWWAVGRGQETAPRTAFFLLPSVHCPLPASVRCRLPSHEARCAKGANERGFMP